MTDETNFLQVYGAELLPSCPCYMAEDGDVSEQAKMQLGMLNQLGLQVGACLIDSGACSEAMPSLLAVLVSAVTTTLVENRTGVRIENATDMIPEFRRVMLRVAELLPLEQARTERCLMAIDTEEGRVEQC